MHSRRTENISIRIFIASSPTHGLCRSHYSTCLTISHSPLPDRWLWWGSQSSSWFRGQVGGGNFQQESGLVLEVHRLVSLDDDDGTCLETVGNPRYGY